jgi:hypothetical protein
MQRITSILATVAVAGALLISPSLAQTSTQPPKSSLTPQQREEVRAMKPQFTACHNKAIAAKVGPKDRRAYMKNCLAGTK